MSAISMNFGSLLSLFQKYFSLRLSHIFSFLRHAKCPIKCTLTAVLELENLAVKRHLGAEKMVGLLDEKHEWHLQFLYRSGETGNECHFGQFGVF